jgi:uncharacterized membrane protein
MTRETSSTGLDPNVAAALAYLAWWITGALFFLIERESSYVRFHAMQSLLALGVLWAIGLALWIGGFVLVFLTGAGLGLMTALANLVWLIGVIAWVICLIKAYAGERWKLPLAGDLAERFAERRQGHL